MLVKPSTSSRDMHRAAAHFTLPSYYPPIPEASAPSCFGPSTLIVFSAWFSRALMTWGTNSGGIFRFIPRILALRIAPHAFRQMMGAIGAVRPARLVNGRSASRSSMVVLKLKGARKRMKVATGRCEGRKPFGSRPGETKLLDRMRTMRTAGSTFDAIAAALNADAVPTRLQGGRWFGSTVAKMLRRIG